MKIMIIDTQGPTGISDKYAALLPHCTFRGYELGAVAGTACHPHGLMCGYLAGVIQQEPTEIVFVRIFDQQGNPLSGSHAWMLRVIREERPDVISRSWGAWDGDTGAGEDVAIRAWSDWVQDYATLKGEVEFVDFAAAGNNDCNDEDADVDYPHCLMPEVSNIIGSCRRDGIPSEFSGDGPGVQCCAWAERINLCNNGSWELGSGTSFAAPKMAGVCALYGLSNKQWREYVRLKATRPKGFDSVVSAKWGHGCMEHTWQEALAQVANQFRPPIVKSVIPGIKGHVRWHDFRLVV